MLKFLSLSLRPFTFILGWIVFKIIQPRKSVVEKQLRESGFKDYKVLAQKHFEHLRLMVQEIVFMFSKTSEDLVKRTEVIGYQENILPYLKREESVLFLTAHLGNWEWGLALAKGLQIPLVGIVKRVRSKTLQNLMTKFREKFGVQLVWEENSMDALQKAFATKKSVVVVLDQYMGPPIGVKVNFFNRGAGTMKALAILAKRYKKDVVPVFFYRKSPFQMEAQFLPALKWQEVENLNLETQVYTYIIESAILRHPEQWFWIHRRWKQDTSALQYSEAEKHSIGKKLPTF